MASVFRLAAAFVAGAAVMYYLDPIAGRRRRALVRDKGFASAHDVQAFARAKVRHAADRMHGAVARMRTSLAAAPVADAQLHARIRARIGHLLAQPGAVSVDVVDGYVMLTGSAAPSEIDDLLDTVATMRGVEALEHDLTVAQAGYIAPGTH